jgi:dolichyl-phosphate beta-glucosyltransferase
MSAVRLKPDTTYRFLQWLVLSTAMNDVCLVIPCFNEQNRLPQCQILESVQGRAGLSICFVDDGSTDGTRGVLAALQVKAPSRIEVIGLRRNCGKAEAVRQGILHVTRSNRFAFVGYWDADLSTPLEDLECLTSVLNGSPTCLLAMGSRVKRLGSFIDRHLWRHITGRIFATSASAISRLPVYDSQCGAKLFRRGAAAVVFRDPFVTQWLFDVEILVRLRNRLGVNAVLESVTEVPLKTWVDVGGSKLRVRHLLGVPFDLLKIHLRYNGKPVAPKAPEIPSAISSSIEEEITPGVF